MKSLFLAFIVFVTPYNRADWVIWSDADKDCQDTRQEVLIRDVVEAEAIPDELNPSEFTLDPSGCRVVTGTWHDFYTGKHITSVSKIDIDHVVPLKEAHESGGWQWSPQKKAEYANDLDNLVVASQHTNRSKGSKRPDQWLPASKAGRCAFISKWLLIKTKYGLSFAEEKKAKVLEIAKDCDEHLGE